MFKPILISSMVLLSPLAAGQCPDSTQELVHIVAGDSSGDGHARTKSFLVCTSLKRAEIKQAYGHGVDKIGFDLVADIAEEFEDDTITVEQLKKLRSQGALIRLEDEEYADGDKVSMSVDEYIAIYLWFVKIGNPTFEYKILIGTATIDVGGYGLLY